MKISSRDFESNSRVEVAVKQATLWQSDKKTAQRVINTLIAVSQHCNLLCGKVNHGVNSRSHDAVEIIRVALSVTCRLAGVRLQSKSGSVANCWLAIKDLNH
jgi:hypothetical protein